MIAFDIHQHHACISELRDQDSNFINRVRLILDNQLKPMLEELSTHIDNIPLSSSSSTSCPISCECTTLRALYNNIAKEIE